MSKLQFSEMQKDYWNNATHRWNIKTGATGSGKTFLDFYLLPKRIRACTGKGLIVLLGNTRSTLNRNILDPLRGIYGDSLVGSINNENEAMLFGKKVYCLGADKVNQVSKIQGATIEYCYGDEITTWNQEVFEMLKSRLRCENSCFDGTCNPKGPDHWLKAFLESDADVYLQEYTIFDNPFLPEDFVRELCKEYAGTVYYDRFILGKWALAEGLLYKFFADKPEPYLFSEPDLFENGKLKKPFSKITVGIDFGGNKSRTTFVATGFVDGYKQLMLLDSDSLPICTEINAKQITDKFIEFVRRMQKRYGFVEYTFGDNASSTMVYTLMAAADENNLNTTVGGCDKDTILNRVRTIGSLLNTGRLLINRKCTDMINALSTLRWADDKEDEVEDKNVNSCNDWFDAFSYSFTPWIDAINLNM